MYKVLGCFKGMFTVKVIQGVSRTLGKQEWDGTGEWDGIGQIPILTLYTQMEHL